MIIAVQRGMASIKEQLEDRGYKVVFKDEYNHPIDVLIHKGKRDVTTAPLTNSPLTNELSNSILHGNSHYGAVMEINASGKSIRDIEMMLYSKRHNNTHIL